MSGEVTHKCPRRGEMVTPCCGKTPFELPLNHRLTAHAELVDCPEWFADNSPEQRLGLDRP